MVTSDEYRHVPTGVLARLAQRLGKVLYKGQWLRKYDVEKLKYAAYMKARGYVNYHGKWRKQKDAKKIQRDVVRQLNRLTNKYSGARRRAHKELLKLSKKHHMPRLVAIAGRVKKDYDEYWRTYWRRQTILSRTVTMGISSTAATGKGVRRCSGPLPRR